MRVDRILDVNLVMTCTSNADAYAVLTGLRETGIPYSPTGAVDPTKLTELQGQLYTRATFAAMQKHYLDVLSDVYDFLYKDNDPTRELTDNEYCTLNMLLILCEE